MERDYDLASIADFVLRVFGTLEINVISSKNASRSSPIVAQASGGDLRLIFL